MDREIKYKVLTSCGRVIVAPSENFSLMLNDTGHTVVVWSSDGACDELTVEAIYQYTGLKDKNGVEIYRSDVLKNPAGETFVVVWNCNGHWGYKRTSDNSSFNQDWWECEVIGNIYETP